MGSLPEAIPTRFLGLDVGNRRIGVAVSDELGLTVQPVMTLERKRNPREDLRSLARLARKFGIAGIVVGNPVHMNCPVCLSTFGMSGLRAMRLTRFCMKRAIAGRITARWWIRWRPP